MIGKIELVKEQKGLREEQKGLREEQEKLKAYDIIIKFQTLANQELRSNNRYMSKELMTSFNEARKAIEYLKTVEKGDKNV